MSLTTNIISYWKLDGNSTDSAGSNNGSDTTITYSNANGIINNGAGFNGTTSLISLGTTSTLNVSGAAYSVSFWNKPASTTGPQGIISRRESSGGAHPNEGWTILYSNTSQKYSLIHVTSGGASSSVVNSTAVGTGTFKHLLVTVDGSGNVQWYLNGVADGTGTVTLVNNADVVTSYIGQGQDDLVTFLCNGAIDEVGVWTRALSGAEAVQLYNGGVGLQYPFGTANTGSFFAMAT